MAKFWKITYYNLYLFYKDILVHHDPEFYATLTLTASYSTITIYIIEYALNCVCVSVGTGFAMTVLALFFVTFYYILFYREEYKLIIQEAPLIWSYRFSRYLVLLFVILSLGNFFTAPIITAVITDQCDSITRYFDLGIQLKSY